LKLNIPISAERRIHLVMLKEKRREKEKEADATRTGDAVFRGVLLES